MRVSEETEAGHVGNHVRSDPAQHVRRVLVERAHPVDRALELHRAGQTLLVAGHDQSGPQRLGDEQRVAGTRTVLRPDPVGMDGADDRKAVLRLRVADRVTSRQKAARRADLGIGGGEDLREHRHRQLLRKRRNRECEQRCAPHREDVVQRVRSRDGAVVAGIVDDRREEVEGKDQRPFVVEAIDRGVVCRRQPDEQVLRLRGHEAGQQLLEPGCRVLGSTAAAGCEICELHSAGIKVHGSSP